MVAGYNNLKDSRSLQDTIPVTQWKRKGLYQTHHFNHFSFISAVCPSHYCHLPVQKWIKLKINVSVQRDNLKALPTLVLVLSLKEMKQNTIPHKSQQRGRKHAAYAFIPFKWSWCRFTLAAWQSSQNQRIHQWDLDDTVRDVDSVDAAILCLQSIFSSLHWYTQRTPKMYLHCTLHRMRSLHACITFSVMSMLPHRYIPTVLAYSAWLQDCSMSDPISTNHLCGHANLHLSHENHHLGNNKSVGPSLACQSMLPLHLMVRLSACTGYPPCMHISIPWA